MTKTENQKAANKEAIRNARMQLPACQGAEVIFEDLALGLLVVRRAIQGTDCVTVVAFSGRRMKPDFHNRFGASSYAFRYVTDWINNKKMADVRNKEHAEKMNKSAAYAVGDVLVSKWGYEQTNVTYYQVTRLVGKCSLEVREIEQERVENEGMQGLCIPLLGCFKSDPKTYRITLGSIKVSGSGIYAHKKEPIQMAAGFPVFKPDHFTAYY